MRSNLLGVKMKTKICIKCNEEKSMDEFRIVNNRYINTCNKCIKKWLEIGIGKIK